MDHISVCICTYKRPAYLKRLLVDLEKQLTENLFYFSIVVVDNDYNQSAKEIITAFKRTSSLDVDYCIEPEQNIALARNKAVENAVGDFIALIDDDEFPPEKWLLNLYKDMKRYKSDGILGPVVPHFEEPPPSGY